MSSSLTILFVDDDIDLLEAQKAFFTARGHQVLTAENREEALAILDAHTPDIIFLDLMMEHYDSGFTLAYRIRKDERFKGVPLVMLSGVASQTGHRFDRELEQLKEWSKLDGFLDKPVTGKQLLKVIEEKLGLAPEGH